MAGHSKWNNIKHRKEKTDAQRAKIFTKTGREISVAVKEGGADPAANGKLRDLIAKAKSMNVPNENIERIIKKAASGEDRSDYESISYEGYGPEGAAVIVEALTDNRNRTAADVRHYFDKYGGNLGTAGCVSYMFETKGIIMLETDDPDKTFEDAIESGAEDVEIFEETVRIITSAEDFAAVKQSLSDKDYTFDSAEIEPIPSSYVTLSEESVKKMTKMLELLEDSDDVQRIWHNAEV